MSMTNRREPAERSDRPASRNHITHHHNHMGDDELARVGNAA